MSSNRNWIMTFDIGDPKKHKKGFTVYKVTSRVFPRNDYSGLTTLSVWKRFNEFKELYKELEQIHKQLYLHGKFPAFPKGVIFKRFDPDVIKERQVAALELLSFASNHFQLYSSKAFTKFFEEGFDEGDILHLHSQSTSERKLDINPELIPCLVPDKLWVKDELGDIVETHNGGQRSRTSSWGSECEDESLQNVTSFPTSPICQSGIPRSQSDFVVSSKAQPTCSVPDTEHPTEVDPSNHTHSNNLKESDSLPVNESLNSSSSEAKSNPTESLRRNSSISSSEAEEYICEAAGHFSNAQKHESNGNFEKAFASYKEGIRILFAGVENDFSSKRKALVRKKIEQYLFRAEDIYQNILCVERERNFFHSPLKFKHRGSTCDPVCLLKSPVSELQDYRILRVAPENLYIVMSIRDDPQNTSGCYALKVVPFASSLIEEELPTIVPTNVPYMVKLVKWFETTCSYILLLSYAGGGRLQDYIKSFQERSIEEVAPEANSEFPTNSIELLPKHSVVTQELSSFSNAQLNQPCVSVEELIKSSRKLIDSVEKTISGDIKPITLENHSKRSTSCGLKQHAFKIATQYLFRSMEDIQITTASTENGQHIGHQEPEYVRSSKNSSNKIIHYIAEEEETDVLRSIPEACIIGWAVEIICCLDKLHLHGIVYGDLAMKNILLGENGRVLVAFKAYWSKVERSIPSKLNEYSAPELKRSMGDPSFQLHPSCDFWSLGAILFELFTGKNVHDVHPEGFFPETSIFIPARDLSGNSISSNVKSLLTELLTVEPSMRLGYYGAEEVKSHPCFQNVDWDSIQGND